jgi:hypothetical protein
VKVAHVSDPQSGNEVVDSSLPSRPVGSLPILAIPLEAMNGSTTSKEWVYIRQSMAIINYLEELCNTGQYSFFSPRGSLIGDNSLARARVCEVLALAEECTVAW